MKYVTRFLGAVLVLSIGGACGGSSPAKSGTGGANGAGGSTDAGSDASVDQVGDTAPTDAGADSGPTAPHAVQSHSSAIVVNPAGTRLYVVHPDADSVSVLDLATRAILHEVLLAAKPVTVDSAGHYLPAVAPRALALDSTGRTLYVTGQRSGHLYALDATSGAIVARRRDLLRADRRAGQRRRRQRLRGVLAR